MSYGETCSINRQKPKIKSKKKDAKRYKAIYCMTCRTGCRISESSWSMKVVLQSYRVTLRREVKTLPSHLMNFQWSREHTWNRVRVSTVFLRFFDGPKLRYLLEDKKYRGLLAEDAPVQSCTEWKILAI